MGTFSEQSQETPLGIFIHLVEKLAAFAGAQDGGEHEIRETATFLLGEAGAGRKGDLKPEG